MWKTLEINPKYEVNEQGEIRHATNLNILQGNLTKDGYHYYTLTSSIDNKTSQTVRAHRCVALAFLENPNNLSEVHHIDGNKLNNNVENLKWVSHEENMEHWREEQTFYTKVEIPLTESSIKGKCKPVHQYSLEGELIATYPSINEAGRAIGVNSRNLGEVTRGLRHTCGGFIWRFV